MAAVDYVGRQFDILAFRGQTPRGEIELQQTLFDSAAAGEVCTGITKLAQRWLLEFLTVQGSIPFSTRGSDFMTWWRQGRLRTEYDVQAYFGFAAQQVQVQLRNEETSDMPADERLQSATLDRLQLQLDEIALNITITSLAGTARSVILPLTITPANLALGAL